MWVRWRIEAEYDDYEAARAGHQALLDTGGTRRSLFVAVDEEGRDFSLDDLDYEWSED